MFKKRTAALGFAGTYLHAKWLCLPHLGYKRHKRVSGKIPMRRPRAAIWAQTLALPRAGGCVCWQRGVTPKWKSDSHSGESRYHTGWKVEIPVKDVYIKQSPKMSWLVNFASRYQSGWGACYRQNQWWCNRRKRVIDWGKVVQFGDRFRGGDMMWLRWWWE